MKSESVAKSDAEPGVTISNPKTVGSDYLQNIKSRSSAFKKCFEARRKDESCKLGAALA